MADILNKNYEEVNEYDFICKKCGAMIRFKEYELTSYKDENGNDCLSYQCPNCKFHNVSSKEHGENLKKINDDFSERLCNTIIESTKTFNQSLSIAEPIFYLVCIGLFALFCYICS